MRRQTFLKSALAAASATIGTAIMDSAPLDDDTPPTSAEPVAAQTPDVPDYDEFHRLVSGDEPLTWVFTGDSITQGAFFTNGWRHYVQHVEERVRWEMLRKWDFVINTGVSAERSDHILGDFDNRVARFAPAIVSLMIGTNDAVNGPDGREVFRDNVSQLVDGIRDTGAIPLLATFNPVSSAGDPARTDLPQYAQLVRDVAKEHETILIDHFAQWTSLDPDVTDAWHGDAIHPNEIGHLVMARKTLDVLGIADPDSPTGRLRVE